MNKPLHEATSRIRKAQKINLTHLDLSWLELTELPEMLSELTQLKSLNLLGNDLTHIPESIGHLFQLQILNLFHNQLEMIPESLGGLLQLQELCLSCNQLIQIPESIGNLTALRRLDLSNNRLNILPFSLRKLTLLNELYLDGNSNLGIPAEILGPSFFEAQVNNIKPAAPGKIVTYYLLVHSEKRPLNEAKLIFVGRGAVGKTSLVTRLVHNRFTPDEKKTEGIQITEWKLTLNGNEKVRLNIWDFGGQEIMHATHQFFLTKRSLYVLVLNGREGVEDADAEYWLKLIDSFGGNSPVIIVLNRINEHPFDLNRRGLLEKYPAIKAFVKTDCENGTGIDELHKIIEWETDRLENLRDAFPAMWFTIKDKLSGMKENYLSYAEFRKFCHDNGEMGNDAQNALAGYLHTLGIALNFTEDPRLHDTHVLNPHWVTNGIYKILNSKILSDQRGEIHLDGVKRILDPGEYPTNMCRFIFDLMKKFDLCFNFPDNDCHYLIPELLDKEESTETEKFKPEECLNFQYHYSVLPEGLLPRFIVRTHILSEKEPKWRTGVILRFEDCRALVRADLQDKKVFISVTGHLPNRRRLLAIIRSYFDEIHNAIPKLRPKEMVPLPNYPAIVIGYKELLVREKSKGNDFDMVIGEEVVKLSVEALLNGIDLDETRRIETVSEKQREPVKLVYSYSHKDEKLRNELETHLKLLQRIGIISTWHDRKIDAGDVWKKKIDENIEKADIILLLVSADFFASDYCYEIEMKHALERHEKQKARLIPVILRDVNWKKAPFAKLQALPIDGKPVTTWANKDSAWRNVAEGIEEITTKFLEDRKRIVKSTDKDVWYRSM